MKKLTVLLVAVLAIFSVYTAASAAEEKVGFVDEKLDQKRFVTRDQPEEEQ